jgi:hypothetical protein
MRTVSIGSTEARTEGALGVTSRLRKLLIACEHPLIAGLIAFIVYEEFALMFKGNVFQHANVHAYYNYLADAFLHGQLHLRVVPPSTHDLTYYHDHYYLYWGPMPAIMLMPFVALFGYAFSDSIFSIGIAAANVALMAVLLRLCGKRGIVQISPIQRACLVLFFAFGTVHLLLAPYSNVWSTDETVAFFFVLLAYIAAIGLTGPRAFFLTGLALTGALLTRNHVILTGVFPAAMLIYNHRSLGARRIAANLLLAASPILAGVGIIGLYDLARFGSPLDNGIAYHLMDKAFLNDYQRYGYFNVHYIPTNLYYQYIYYPFPIRHYSTMGGSLLLLSPVFFGAFWGVVRGRPQWLIGALVASILLTAIPILLLMGTGWVQFGPRYTLDFTVPLIVLTAIGIRRWPNRLVALLTFLSMAQYFIGVAWFGSLY